MSFLLTILKYNDKVTLFIQVFKLKIILIVSNIIKKSNHFSASLKTYQ